MQNRKNDISIYGLYFMVSEPAMRRRIVDSINFAEDRKEPPIFFRDWGNYINPIFGDEKEISAELLKKIYCKKRRRNHENSFLDSIVTKSPGAPLFNKQAIEELTNLLTDGSITPNQVVAIKGDVGIGKSTYLAHYFTIELLEKKMDNRYGGIFVNLKRLSDYSTETEDIRIKLIEDFIINQIHQQLSEFLPEIKNPSLELMETIFDIELNKICYRIEAYEKLGRIEDANIEKLDCIKKYEEDEDYYNQALFRYIKKRYNKELFVILDNVDHFPDIAQQRIFQTCQMLVSQYKCTLFLAIRGYTYPQAYRYSGMSAFAPRSINLSEPDIHCIISKREGVLLNQIIRENPESVKTEAFIELKRTINSIKKPENLKLLWTLSNGDLRFLLRLVRIILQSNCVDKGKTNGIVNENTLLKAIMLGNDPAYHPNRRYEIVNLFDNQSQVSEGNNLIRIRLLQSIPIFGDSAIRSEVIEFMGSIGYSAIDVDTLITLFLQMGLIGSSCNENPANTKFLVLTRSGRYYIESLYKNIRYLLTVQHSTYLPLRASIEIEKAMKSNDDKRIFNSLIHFINFIQDVEDEERKKNQLSEISMKNYNKLSEIASVIRNSYYSSSPYI
jgi:hypothetical protein